MVALASLGACSSSEPTPPVHSPSPFFSSGSGGGTASTATGTSGATATGANGDTGSSGGGPGGGHVETGPTGSGGGARGSVRVRISGDLHVEKHLTELVTGTYAPAGGVFAVVWTAGGTDPSTVSLGGLSFVGTRASANTLTLTITVPAASGGFATFVSMNGECRISITRATSTSVDGSFRCANLESATGVVVAATATFSASG